MLVLVIGVLRPVVEVGSSMITGALDGHPGYTVAAR
jgi:hypothetical protein